VAIQHFTHHHKQHSPPAIIIKVNCEDIPVPLTDALRREYNRFYSTLVIKPNKVADVDNTIKRILIGKPRYIEVSKRTGVPWEIIGVIHHLECDCNFNCHLHNGDPLARRTVNAPKNRPVAGFPPFKWEDSAVDALQFQELHKWKDWSVSGTLYKLELYNGFGSRNHGVASPYLWGGTTFYTKGKYILDSKWDANAISAQIGASAVLYKMSKDALILFPEVR
jgi:lysozyme family protein